MSRASLGLAALAGFFAFGSLAAGVAAATLMFPGSVAEPLWRFNPTGYAALNGMGAWGVALMALVAVACAAAAAGLARRTRWGHRIALGLLFVNLVADIVNAIARDPRTLIGVAVAGAFIVFLLSNGVRAELRRRSAMPNNAGDAG